MSIDDFLFMTAEDPIYEDDVFAISADLCNKVVETLQTAPECASVIYEALF